MLQEWHYYFQNTLRWRNLRKITVAQVQGTVYAAGLMLMWACDLIVAADNALFADVVGTRLGMCGIEYFGHPWEFGPRKAKELMLTGDAISVQEAHRLGMVSKIFPTDELTEQTLAFAKRIAQVPTMAALLDQGVGEPDRRQHGLLQFPAVLLHPARAEPRPLGRGPRGQVPGGAGRGRDRRLEEPAAGAAGGARRRRGTLHQAPEGLAAPEGGRGPGGGAGARLRTIGGSQSRASRLDSARVTDLVSGGSCRRTPPATGWTHLPLGSINSRVQPRRWVRAQLASKSPRTHLTRPAESRPLDARQMGSTIGSESGSKRGTRGDHGSGT